MIIIIVIFLIIVGLLIFRPFSSVNSNRRNYRLLGMSIYLISFIIAIGAYCYYNQDILFANNLGGGNSENNIILNRADSNVYDIKINPMSEYDQKTKNEIYSDRKHFVEENYKFVNSNYSPQESILAVDDRRVWWGTKGMVCKGPGRNSYEGLSKASNYSNNPLILVNFDMGKAVTEGQGDCDDEMPVPTSLKIQPSTKTFTVHYDVSNFIKKRRGTHFHDVMNSIALFTFGTINARDFGYNYIFASEIKNIRFENYPNIYSEITSLNSYWCIGNNCRVSGGCNNICGDNRRFSFFIDDYPAYAKFKLYKHRPRSFEAAPDVWFEIYLD